MVYPMKTTEYFGQQCVELSNDWLTLLVTQSVGPRVISLKTRDDDNLFASLPDTTLDYPGEGEFHLYGGHRLWHAPEEPRRTYIPDDQAVEIISLERGLQVKQAIEPGTGIQKELNIQLAKDSPIIEIKHSLTNCGLWPVTCAPWAITQMKPGGVALLPQNLDLWENNPTLPNRPITLWPYTDFNSPSITWGNDVILIHATMTKGMLKIGYPNQRGWLAYWLNETLFIKRAVFDPKAEYFDFGSSSECYCNDQFLELETLGPIATLKPGESATHFETWEVHPEVPWSDDLTDLINLIE
jgi:hypothetical protein